MLTVFVFDERTSERVDDWRAALGRITDDRLLWFALRDPTEAEVAELRDALELDRENAQMLLEQPATASVAGARERSHLTPDSAVAGGRSRAFAPDAVRGRDRGDRPAPRTRPVRARPGLGGHRSLGGGG